MIAPPVTLYGYRYSVYTRIARLALLAKGVDFAGVDIDPFTDPPADWRDKHPFGRVPVLIHADFTIFETGAITRYIDRAFPGPSLQPDAPQDLARMDQTIAIIDGYGYWPLVRQVFAHGVFRPLSGEIADPAQIAQGLAAAAPVLVSLDAIAAEGRVLSGAGVTLADIHLAPMIDYFQRAPEGAAAFADYPALRRWWAQIATLPIIRQTAPDLSSLTA